MSRSEVTSPRNETRPVPNRAGADHVALDTPVLAPVLAPVIAPALEGRLNLYHPNGKGTGAALQLELRLNRRRDDRYNCFFLEMAKQMAARAENGDAFARFDWAGKVTTKLAFLDVCAVLTVLEGRCDSIGPNGKGLYHQTPTSNTLISLSRDKNAGGGVMLGVSRKDQSQSDPMRMSMRLSASEATGLRHVFASGMIYLALWRAPVMGGQPERSDARPPT